MIVLQTIEILNILIDAIVDVVVFVCDVNLQLVAVVEGDVLFGELFSSLGTFTVCQIHFCMKIDCEKVC